MSRWKAACMLALDLIMIQVAMRGAISCAHKCYTYRVAKHSITLQVRFDHSASEIWLFFTGGHCRIGEWWGFRERVPVVDRATAEMRRIYDIQDDRVLYCIMYGLSIEGHQFMPDRMVGRGVVLVTRESWSSKPPSAKSGSSSEKFFSFLFLFFFDNNKVTSWVTSHMNFG